MDQTERMHSLKRRYGRTPSHAPVKGPMGGPGRGPGARAAAGRGGRPRQTRQTVRRLMAYLKEDKLRMTMAFVCVILNTFGTLAGAYMLRPIINTYIVPTDGSRGSAAGLAGALAVMAGVYLIGVCANYLQARIMLTVAQGALKRIRNDLFAKLQSLPVRYYDTNSNGDIMSRFTNDVDTIGMMLSSTLVQLFSGMLSIVGTVALMLYTNVWLTLVTVVMMPLMMKAGGAVARRSQRFFSAQQASLGAVNGYIEETVTGQKVRSSVC